MFSRNVQEKSSCPVLSECDSLFIYAQSTTSLICKYLLTILAFVHLHIYIDTFQNHLSIKGKFLIIVNCAKFKNNNYVLIFSIIQISYSKDASNARWTNRRPTVRLEKNIFLILSYIFTNLVAQCITVPFLKVEKPGI